MSETWSPMKVQGSDSDLRQARHVLDVVSIMLRLLIIEVVTQYPGGTISPIHPTPIDMLTIAAQVGSNIRCVVFWLVVVFSAVFQLAGCSDDALVTGDVFADALF